MAEFELNVHDIDEVGKDYDFPIPQAWLVQELADAGVRPLGDADGPDGPGGPDDSGDGAFRVRAHKQGLDIVLSGTLRARLVAECSRCLEDAPIDVDMRYASLLSARGADVRPVADEVELTPEDLDREFYTGETIVLDDSVREHLLLEVPMQPLCSPDCTGIAIPKTISGPADLRADAPGANGDAVDPRLAPLMLLADRLGPAEES